MIARVVDGRFCGHTRTIGRTTWVCIQPADHMDEDFHSMVSAEQAATEAAPLPVEVRTRSYFPLTY